MDLKLYVPGSCDFGGAETAEEDPHTLLSSKVTNFPFSFLFIAMDNPGPLLMYRMTQMHLSKQDKTHQTIVLRCAYRVKQSVCHTKQLAHSRSLACKSQ